MNKAVVGTMSVTVVAAVAFYAVTQVKIKRIERRIELRNLETLSLKLQYGPKDQRAQVVMDILSNPLVQKQLKKMK